MKQFEYVYFTIYHYYSRQSYFPDSLAVRLKSMYLLALSVAGWILCLQLFFLRFVKNAWFTSQQTAMLFALTIYTGITFFFYYHFIQKQVDQKIFSKYESSWNNNPNKQRDLFLAITAAATPYLVILLIKIFFPRAN